MMPWGCPVGKGLAVKGIMGLYRAPRLLDRTGDSADRGLLITVHNMNQPLRLPVHTIDLPPAPAPQTTKVSVLSDSRARAGCKNAK
jgi:hypothetical protein